MPSILINKPLGNISIRINPAVAEERPVAAYIFHQGVVDFGYDNFFLVVRGFCQDFALRTGNKRSSPKFDSCGGFNWLFETYPVAGCYKNTVGHCMSALNSAPGIVLFLAILCFFRRMPANGGRVEEYFGTLQSGNPCSFRIPLIPAN